MCTTLHTALYIVHFGVGRGGLVQAMKSVIFVANKYKNRTDHFHYVVTF